MNQQLELLIMLHDVDLLLKEMQDEKTLAEEREMGFKIKKKHELEKARQELIKDIEPDTVRTYKRLHKHYGRAVAPVVNHICCGCFMQVATSISLIGAKNEEVFTCERCGRFLYWVD